MLPFQGAYLASFRVVSGRDLHSHTKQTSDAKSIKNQQNLKKENEGGKMLKHPETFLSLLKHSGIESFYTLANICDICYIWDQLNNTTCFSA